MKTDTKNGRIFAVVLKKRKLIFDLAKNDFMTKYAGSYLGIIWAFIQPVVTILVYWFVFQVGFSRTNSMDGVPFVLWLTTGFIPWFFFNDAINSGTSSLLDYNYLVKKVVFDVQIIPVVRITSAFFIHTVFTVFIIILYIINGIWPCITWIQVFYYMCCLILFITGIVYIISAVVIFFRDLSQLVIIALQVGVWLTPIMWKVDTIASPAIKLIIKLNPMYYIVQGYRDSMIYHIWFFERPLITIYFWVITITVLFLGQWIFKRLRIHFADMM